MEAFAFDEDIQRLYTRASANPFVSHSAASSIMLQISAHSSVPTARMKKRVYSHI
jgi:hypothetical protein